jgi:hypothetical protein
MRRDHKHALISGEIARHSVCPERVKLYQADTLQRIPLLVNTEAAPVIADQSLTPPDAYAIIAPASYLYFLAELQWCCHSPGLLVSFWTMLVLRQR